MDITYYARQCEECNKSMNIGITNGTITWCSEKCCREAIGDDSYDQAEKDWAAGHCRFLDWTDWEHALSEEDFLFLEDGTEVENPFEGWNYKDIRKVNPVFEEHKQPKTEEVTA